MRTATAAAAGTSCRASSSRFPVISDVNKFRPVALPPGRLRLATRPNLTGSSPPRKTIGIVVVAALAASAEVVPVVAITATERCTKSDASAGRRSNLPSAHLYSITTLRPDVPRFGQALAVCGQKGRIRIGGAAAEETD